MFLLLQPEQVVPYFLDNTIILNLYMFPTEQSQLSQHTDHCNSNILGKNLKTNAWIIATGASSHISNSLHHFTNIESINNWTILLPNNLRLQATHLGDIHLNDDLVLFDVLYVPSFQYNLLSVSKLSSSLKYEVLFTAENCLIQDSITKKKIGSAEVKDGLYILNTDTMFAFNYVFISKCNKDEIWHYKLGHISNNRIAILNKTYSDIFVPSDFVCDICNQSK